MLGSHHQWVLSGGKKGGITKPRAGKQKGAGSAVSLRTTDVASACTMGVERTPCWSKDPSATRSVRATPTIFRVVGGGHYQRVILRYKARIMLGPRTYVHPVSSEECT